MVSSTMPLTRKAVKVKQSLYKPGEALKAAGRLPEFIDSRHMKVTRLSALRTGCLYLPPSPGDTPNTRFC